MLGRRYINDGLPRYILNHIQIKTKKEIEDKIKNNLYKFEKKSCEICNNLDFELLSLKDRHGLLTPVSICTNCGLIQTNPRMTQDSYNQFYELDYRKLYLGRTNPSTRFFESQISKGRRIYNFLKNSGLLSKLKKDSLVFEVGCGAGGILHFFKEKGYNTQGCDLDKQYLEYGREKFNLNLSYSTIEDIKLEKSPDLIIYSHVMEHILSPKRELSKVHDILSNNGLLYIEVPGIRSIPYSHKGNFLAYLQNAHTYHFTLKSLKSLLEMNKFILLSGNEYIESVFKKERVNKSSQYESDYHSVLTFLKDMETDFFKKKQSTNKLLKLIPDTLYFQFRCLQERNIFLFHFIKKFLYRLLRKEIKTIIS